LGLAPKIGVRGIAPASTADRHTDLSSVATLPMLAKRFFLPNTYNAGKVKFANFRERKKPL
jgi:hypothetical protein